MYQKSCQYCGEKFETKTSTQKNCSKSCKSLMSRNEGKMDIKKFKNQMNRDLSKLNYNSVDSGRLVIYYHFINKKGLQDSVNDYYNNTKILTGKGFGGTNIKESRDKFINYDLLTKTDTQSKFKLNYYDLAEILYEIIRKDVLNDIDKNSIFYRHITKDFYSGIEIIETEGVDLALIYQKQIKKNLSKLPKNTEIILLEKLLKNFLDYIVLFNTNRTDVEPPFSYFIDEIRFKNITLNKLLQGFAQFLLMKRMEYEHTAPNILPIVKSYIIKRNIFYLFEYLTHEVETKI